MADAQYAIDIASKMVGGDETLSQLDALTQGLLGGGKDADFFQEAMQRVAKELTGAAAASTVANEALAAGEAEYSRLERAALQAAKAAEKAGAKNEGVVPDDLAAKAAETASAVNAYADTLRTLESNAKAADAAENGLQKTQDNLQTLNGHVNKSLGEQGEKFEKLRNVMGATGGQLGQLGSKLLAPVQGFAKLSATMGAGAAAAVIVTVAVVALAAALLAAGVAALSFGIKTADAARSAGLTQAALEAVTPALASVHSELGALTNATGVGQVRLDALAQSLVDAHVSAKNLPSALRAAATAEAALGQGGASKFVEQIKAGTLTVDAFSKNVQDKLGGIVAKQMLSLSSQGERLKANVAGIFGGLNIEPFLTGLSRLVGLFDKDTAAGQTLKFAFETLFQPLLDHADDVAIALEAVALKILIVGLKVYIALKPWTPLFKDIGAAVIIAGLAFAATFTPAILSAVVALGALVVSAVIAAAPFLAIGAAVVAVYEAFTHWDQITAIVSGVFDSVVALGGNLITGLVNGIKAGAGAVWDAIGGVVSGAIDHAKALLGIHSPSTVFAGIGDNTVAGFTGAVDSGADDAHAAVAGLIQPPANDNARQAALTGNIAALTPASSAAPASAGAPASSGGGAQVTIQNITISGVEGAEDLVDRLAAELTKILEGDAAQVAGTGTDG